MEGVRAHLRRHVVGYLALFVALSGTAWAANKVTSKEIAKNAVKSKHLKDAQVKPPDVAPEILDGSLVDEAKLDEVPQAANAATLGGQGPGDFLPVGGKAADADKIDGAEVCLPIRVEPGVPEAPLCQVGGIELVGTCQVSGPNLNSQIWLANRSDPTDGNVGGANVGGGGGVWTLLTGASSPTAGAASPGRAAAQALYLATADGDVIAGTMGALSRTHASDPDFCQIMISATALADAA